MSESLNLDIQEAEGFDLEVSRGNKEPDIYGFSKFGFNIDLDTADGEHTLWSYKAASWVAMTAADTLDIASTSGNDIAAGTGARSVTITGLDASGDHQEETVIQSGTWRTLNTWTAVNRVVVATAGSTGYNEGDIRIFGTGSGSTQGFVPTNKGVTQQMIFTPRSGYTAHLERIYVRSAKTSGGSSPKVTINLYQVTSAGVRINHLSEVIDVAQDPVLDQVFKNTIAIANGGGYWYITAETDSNNTFVRCRVEQKETKN